MALLEKILHITFLGVYISVTIFFINNSKKNEKSSDPKVQIVGQFSSRFLTNWTYVLQLFYYICIVLAHLFAKVPLLLKASNKLRSFADLIFTTIALPFGLSVSIAFWSLYAIDRELVYPDWLDKVIPIWLNHALHTFNSILPLTDLVLTKHNFHSWSLTSVCILAYAAAYCGCFFGTYYTYGVWLYPIFEKFSYVETGLFSLMNIVLVLLLHAIVRFFSKLIWGSSSAGTPKANKNKHIKKKVA